MGVETVFGTRFYCKCCNTYKRNIPEWIDACRIQKNERRKIRRSSHQQDLSDQLAEIGFTVERMKTGTSARIDGRTIDFKSMTEQKGDDEGRTFSFLNGRYDY